jgi:type II secretory ATPase GspE/PulE/Tfp pilus assembly ATPase PilB-like protein
VLSVINKTVTDLYRKEPVPALQEQELREIQKLETTLKLLKTGAVLLGGTPFLDKMTTLYALLNHFDPVRKKIVTLDSHSEYRADHYYQIKYAGSPHFSVEHDMHDFGPEKFGQGSHAGSPERKTARSVSSLQDTDKMLSPDQERLSSWLSGIKKHGADVLLVDHLASEVVLAQCLDFAATGVLLASLDFSDVFQMLAYLRDCQVKPSVLTSRVYALIAQQSIRILCQECKQQDSTELKDQILERFHPAGDAAPPEIYAPGTGCPACHRAGYVHQVILFEILPLEPWLKSMLLEGSSLAAIQQTAEEREFQSLEKKCIDLLFSGQTSLEEVFSIVM